MAARIAIVGAGPGGCMLARLLNQRSIPCIIFEGEKSIDYRSQGGSLDLRAGTGLRAIEEAGLYPEFQKLARYDGESLLICDKKLTTWMRRQPSKQGEKNAVQEAPEIDRAVLRKMLIESLPEGCIKWDHRLKKVDEDLNLHFENGRVEGGFDLIVGADGAFSKVRNAVSSEKPMYTRLGGYSMTIPDAEKTAPEAYKIVNRGSVFAFGDGKNLCGQQIGDGSLNITFNAAYDEDYASKCSPDIKDLESVKKHLRKQLEGWSPDLVNFVESTQGAVQWRGYYMLPVGFQWKHKKSITLLGDAAHLMTPFAGIGVNTAFYDAVLLSHAIISFTKIQAGQTDDLDALVVRYEEEMWKFAKGAQELTYNVMQDMMFTPGAPRASIESWVLRFLKAEFPKWSHPLLIAGVYAGYFIYKLFV